MITLADVVDVEQLELMAAAGYVRRQTHPGLPLAILNYTAACQYDRAWNDVTRACRGLIYDVDTLEVVARPFPKFHNHGEHEDGTLDLDAPVLVTDKLDGSLGILYPDHDGYSVATRGSFTSEQAYHATEVYRERYASFVPVAGLTYLFEIIYEDNRIVVDYGNMDDLVLLAAIETATGRSTLRPVWPGLRVEEMSYRTLAEALAAEPRPDAEGLVVYFPDTNLRVKIKQEDYVALHRILTGTNARNVWEFAAVRACGDMIKEPKHWGSFLGIDPARAAELLAVGENWIEATGIPDEFFSWVTTTIEQAKEKVADAYESSWALVEAAAKIDDRRARFEFVQEHGGVYQREVMRIASTGSDVDVEMLRLRCWREACPEPTAPFARDEAIA